MGDGSGDRPEEYISIPAQPVVRCSEGSPPVTAPFSGYAPLDRVRAPTPGAGATGADRAASAVDRPAEIGAAIAAWAGRKGLR
jgi:hypothetical protein